MSSIPQATVLYPQNASTSPHSNGSYSPVFAVLAVITILSISACIIARFCARRICQPQPRADNGFCKGDIESRLASSIPAGKLAKSEAAWIGGKNAESVAKHAEVKGVKPEG
ncbi:uncharacterized protein LOC110116022 [Dendrobium catenatum]|uniref:Uncharacterized protein n=1 Tax=Dendrobium catenatum TaxID=906689 RepID=A0A2I0X3Y9_9ASPA|nr:uncharacterized protein LOC110116022 [Dendrobium catenatum]PKU82626.1 hypothetical protein MA16_Dca022794 [Dendrobium catenatum]